MKYILIILSFFSGCNEPQKTFDVSEWKQSSHCKPIKFATKRQEMLNDLQQKVLVGLSSSKIEEILGKSLKENVLPNVKRNLLYCLGKDGFGLGMKWLLIHLDDKKVYLRSEVIKAD